MTEYLAGLGDAELAERIRVGKLAEKSAGNPNPTAAAQTEIERGKQAWQELFLRHTECITIFGRWKRLARELEPNRGYGLDASVLSFERFSNEVYIRMWTHCKLSSYRPQPPKTFRHWLVVVLNTIYSDLYRELDVHLPLEEQNLPEPEVASPGELVPAASEVQELPLPYRVVFKLVYYHYLNLTREEFRYISKVSECPLEEIQASVRRICADFVGPRGEKATTREDRLMQAFQDYSIAEQEHESLVEQAEAITTESNATSPEVLALAKKVDAAAESVARKAKRLASARGKLDDVVRVPSKEVAQLLGISVDAVDQRLSRARRILKEALGGFDGNAD